MIRRIAALGLAVGALVAVSAAPASAYTIKAGGPADSSTNCVARYSSDSTDNGRPYDQNGAPSASVSAQAHEGLGGHPGRGAVISDMAKSQAC